MNLEWRVEVKLVLTVGPVLRLVTQSITNVCHASCHANGCRLDVLAESIYFDLLQLSSLGGNNETTHRLVVLTPGAVKAVVQVLQRFAAVSGTEKNA